MRGGGELSINCDGSAAESTGGREGGGAARRSMLLADVSRRSYLSWEMSHRRGALGSVHHRRRGQRHVRPIVQGKQRLEGPVPHADGGEGEGELGIREFLLQTQTSPVESTVKGGGVRLKGSSSTAARM